MKTPTKVITETERSTMIKLQATLTKIATKIPVAFNIVQFRDKMGLVREFGKRYDNSTNWILTEKGKQILNVQL